MFSWIHRFKFPWSDPPKKPESLLDSTRAELDCQVPVEKLSEAPCVDKKVHVKPDKKDHPDSPVKQAIVVETRVEEEETAKKSDGRQKRPLTDDTAASRHVKELPNHEPASIPPPPPRKKVKRLPRGLNKPKPKDYKGDRVAKKIGDKIYFGTVGEYSRNFVDSISRWEIIYDHGDVDDVDKREFAQVLELYEENKAFDPRLW